MPILPSGRRVEFSLDRFHALLGRLSRSEARELVETLDNPDDLLFVLDAVHFSLEDGSPYFADYVASDWAHYAAEWTRADREAMQAWLVSDTARLFRAEAVDYIKALLSDCKDSPACYPYVVPSVFPNAVSHPGSLLRQ